MSDTPLLDMRVECTGAVPELRALADNPLAEDSIAESVDAVMRTLGIPGRTRCRVTARDEPDGGPWLRITCDGRSVGCPGELLRRAMAYITQRQLPAPSSAVDDVVWFQRIVEQGVLAGDGGSDLVGVVAMTCASAVKRAPQLLLGQAQFDAYAAELRAVAAPTDSVDLDRAVISGVLEAGLSVGDHVTVGAVLEEGRGADSAETLEALLVRLRPAILEICVAPAYLAELTTSGSEADQALFPFLRDGLFEELGATYADFRFVSDPTLVGNSFQFRINHLTTPPILGLRAGEMLVNDTRERLAAAGIDAEEAVNPATPYPGAIVGPASSFVVEDHPELTTWKPMEYLILSLATALRDHGSRLVDRTAVQSSLERLGVACPDVVQAARELVPLDVLVRLVRKLARDRVPVKNFRLILNEIVAGVATGIDVTDEHGILLLVRAALADAITKLVATSSGTVVAYLVDPTLERAALEADQGANTEDVLAAWRSELETLPVLASRPALLVRDECRENFAEILTREFGFVRVLGYRDIPPGANVQPIARISVQS